MEQFWLDFLTKQVPVVVILGIFSYAMYKYFTAVIQKKDDDFSKILDKKDVVILEKEKEIKELHREVRELTIKCLEAFNRNTEAVHDLRETIRDN